MIRRGFHDDREGENPDFFKFVKDSFVTFHQDFWSNYILPKLLAFEVTKIDQSKSKFFYIYAPNREISSS